MENNHYTSQNFSRLLEERKNQDPESQIAEAGRILSEIDAIDSQSAYLLVSERMNQRNNFTFYLNLLTRVAAVLFVPALVASIWFYSQRSSSTGNQAYAMQEISSPPGVRSKVVLPDGSRVWLNSGSTLKYKLPFEKEIRELSLSGEAFFDVVKNPDAPFVVQAGKARVKVFGTRFNFKAFEKEENLEVVLQEGKVSFNADDLAGSKDFLLKPGDRVVYDKSAKLSKQTNGDIDKYLAWLDGKLVFDETPMQEVARQLERWYGIEVIIRDPQIKKYRITTTFDNESLHQVLELLRLSSPINIQYVKATVDDKTHEQTKSKVLFSGKN